MDRPTVLHGPPGAGAPVPDPVTRGWTAGLLRLLLTVQAALAVAQPILIGRFLDGDFDQLGVHATNGSLLPAIALLCIGAALGHWIIGRGRFWPVLATTLLVPVEGLQIAAGYNHNLAVHIPLGVLIVLVVLVLAAWSWTSRIRRPRPRLRPAPVAAAHRPAAPQPVPGRSL
jgi:hypothetical protein